jgi:transposase-like protein
MGQAQNGLNMAQSNGENPQQKQEMVDLGWQHEWQKTPKLVNQCWRSFHSVKQIWKDSAGKDVVYRCPKCNYQYHVDRSEK